MDEFLNSFDQVRQKVISVVNLVIRIAGPHIKEHKRHTIANGKSVINLEPASNKVIHLRIPRRPQPKHSRPNQSRIRDPPKQSPGPINRLDPHRLISIGPAEQHPKDEIRDLNEVLTGVALQGPADKEENHPVKVTGGADPDQGEDWGDLDQHRLLG